jgi:hypothetical protein
MVETANLGWDIGIVRNPLPDRIGFAVAAEAFLIFIIRCAVARTCLPYRCRADIQVRSDSPI